MVKRLVKMETSSTVDIGISSSFPTGAQHLATRYNRPNTNAGSSSPNTTPNHIWSLFNFSIS